MQGEERKENIDQTELDRSCACIASGSGTDGRRLRKEDRIAILDSGLGGISVLREMLPVMPEERYLYYGDSVNAPYGEKPADRIIEICRGHIERFLAEGVKCVVLACNTATSAAAEVLRKEYPFLPIIGMEPAVKPAAEHKGSQHVLVLATPLTIHGDRLHHLVAEHGGGTSFILREAPGIVRFVEAGICDAAPNEELYAYLRELLSEFRTDPDRTDGADKHFLKLDGVVLGCTHFPFVRHSIEKTLGYPVSVYDGAHGTAVQTRRRLEGLSLLCGTRKTEASVQLSAFKSSERKEIPQNILLQNSDPEKIPLEQMLLSL